VSVLIPAENCAALIPNLNTADVLADVQTYAPTPTPTPPEYIPASFLAGGHAQISAECSTRIFAMIIHTYMALHWF
jgi:hypothetical protein